MDALGERRGVGALEPVHQASLGVEGEERDRADVETFGELVHLLGLDAEETNVRVRRRQLEHQLIHRPAGFAPARPEVARRELARREVRVEISRRLDVMERHREGGDQGRQGKSGRGQGRNGYVLARLGRAGEI